MFQLHYLAPLLYVAIISSFTHRYRPCNLLLDLLAVELCEIVPQTSQVVNHNTYSSRSPTQGIAKGEADHVVIDQVASHLPWGRGWRWQWFRF